MSEAEVLNLQVIRDKFTDSLYESDDILLLEYLDSYQELNKFFKLMGSLFGFVANELVDKIDILQAFLNSVETSEKFHSVKSMVQYEMDEGLLLKKGYVSGSRTLLRLHRGLNFSRMFLRRVHELGERESTVGVCKQVYKDTLANYHTFLVRTGANLAMLGMPTRDQMLCKVCGANKEGIEQALEVLPGMLEVSDKVYDRIQNLYASNNLLNLP